MQAGLCRGSETSKISCVGSGKSCSLKGCLRFRVYVLGVGGGVVFSFLLYCLIMFLSPPSRALRIFSAASESLSPINSITP